MFVFFLKAVKKKTKKNWLLNQLLCKHWCRKTIIGTGKLNYILILHMRFSGSKIPGYSYKLLEGLSNHCTYSQFSCKSKTRKVNAKMTHIQVQNWRKKTVSVSYIRRLKTSHTKHTVLDLFNVCSNNTICKLQWTRI